MKRQATDDLLDACCSSPEASLPPVQRFYSSDPVHITKYHLWQDFTQAPFDVRPNPAYHVHLYWKIFIFTKRYHIGSTEKPTVKFIMSFLTIHESDPDNASIRDVLLCWESGEDGDDMESVQMIPKIEDQHLDSIVNIIPASPRVTSYESIQSDHEKLQYLMMKYPNSVPKSLPSVPPKRTRPLCLFVNYMGTRVPFVKTTEASTKNLKMKAKVMEPSPNPTEAPTVAPTQTKRPRTTSDSCTDDVSQTDGPMRKRVSYVSPMPTLGPTVARMVVSPTH